MHAEAPHNPNLYQGGDEEEPEAPRWDLWTGDGGVAQVTYGGEQEAAVTVMRRLPIIRCNCLSMIWPCPTATTFDF